MKIYDRIINKGMGNFLCPPQHPNHFYSVETDLKRKPENRGSTSLDYCLECDYISQQTKDKAKDLIDSWYKNKPDLTDVAVQKWIKKINYHFSNDVEKTTDYIKKYYPEYKNINI